MTIRLLLDELSRRLRDVEKKQWPEDVLVSAMNAAFAALTNTIPSVYTVERTVELAAGSSQQIPAELHRLVRVLHNVNSDGSPGLPVTRVDPAVMDMAAPGWRSDEPRGLIRHWMQSNIEERRYDVWPPVNAAEALGAAPVVPTEPVAPIAPVDPGPLSAGNVAAGGVRYAEDHNPAAPLSEFKALYIDAEMETNVEHDIVFNVTPSVGNGAVGSGPNANTQNAVRIQHIPNNTPTNQYSALLGLHDSIAGGGSYSGPPYAYLLQLGDPRIEAGQSIRIRADFGRYTLGGCDVIGFGLYDPGVTQADIDAYNAALAIYSDALATYNTELATYNDAVAALAAYNANAAEAIANSDTTLPNLPTAPVNPGVLGANASVQEQFYNGYIDEIDFVSQGSGLILRHTDGQGETDASEIETGGTYVFLLDRVEPAATDALTHSPSRIFPAGGGNNDPNWSLLQVWDGATSTLLGPSDPRFVPGNYYSFTVANGAIRIQDYDFQYNAGVTQAQIDAYDAAFATYTTDLAAYNAALSAILTTNDGVSARAVFTQVPCITAVAAAVAKVCDPEVIVPAFPTDPTPSVIEVVPFFFDQSLVTSGVINGYRFVPGIESRITTTLDEASSRNSGKWYWEVQIDGVGNNSTAIGLYSYEETNNQPLGDGTDGFGIYHTGGTRQNTQNQGTIPISYGPGDTVYVKCDFDAGTFEISVDGINYYGNATLNAVMQGFPNVTWMPALSGLPATDMTLLLSADTITGTIPTGYSLLTDGGETGIDPVDQATYDAAVVAYYDALYAQWLRNAACDGSLPTAPTDPGAAPTPDPVVFTQDRLDENTGAEGILSADGLTLTADNFINDGYITAHPIDSAMMTGSGKYYWETEILVDSPNESNCVGIGVPNAAGTYLGSVADQIGIFNFNTGRRYIGGVANAIAGLDLAVNDIVGHLVDLDAGTYSIIVNGGTTFSIVPTLDTNLTYFPMMSVSQNASIRFTFDVADLSTLPAGYTSLQGIAPQAAVDAYAALAARYDADLAAYNAAVAAVDVEPEATVDPDVLTIDSELPVDKFYRMALLEYACYYCLIVDDDMTANSNRANNHLNAFYQLLNKQEDAAAIVDDASVEAER